MLPFLRLMCLGDADSFLLEAIFRSDVWEFMKEPVSLNNERLVCEAVMKSCRSALKNFDSFKSQPPSTPLEAMCETVRSAEAPVLEDILLYIEREMEGLDLKEYYQERWDAGLHREHAHICTHHHSLRSLFAPPDA